MNKPSDKPLFARNINYLRNQQRLTRKEAARRSGVKSSAWNSYEEGRAMPQLEKLPGICDALKFNDVLAMIEKDLANDKKSMVIDITEAAMSIQKLQQYIKQQ